MTDHTEPIVDTGGSACPGKQGAQPDGCWNQTWHSGMTLRQWYAGQALRGLSVRAMTPDPSARAAFNYADAMIRYEANEAPPMTEPEEPQPMTIKEAIRLALANAMQITGGNRERAAEILGVGERTVYRWLRQWREAGDE